MIGLNVMLIYCVAKVVPWNVREPVVALFLAYLAA